MQAPPSPRSFSPFPSLLFSPLLAPFVYLFASNSAHTFLICSLFSLASSLFNRVRSNRCARRHIFTLYFASVQCPNTLCMKPRAWHSSSAAMTSAQSVQRAC